MRHNGTAGSDSFQTRTGLGQFSGKQRVATQKELNQKAIDRQATDTKQVHRDWLSANGLGDYDPSELFANR